MKEPETFTTRVPQGNLWPNLLAMKPEVLQRAKPPRPLPKNINSAFNIIQPRQQSVAMVGVISTETVQAVLSQGEKANPIA